MPTYLEPGQHIMLSVHVALAPLGMALRAYQCHKFGIMAYSNAQLAGAWFGILMPLWAGLAVLPMYRAGGRLLALWWPLVPSLSLFAPTWNTLYPLLALLAYLLLAEGIAPKVSGPRLAAFQLLRIGLWFGAGLVSVWVVYFLVSGATPITILGAALGQHLELDRPYLPWVFLHLYDLALFTGLPMTLIALAGPARSLDALRRRDWKAVDPLVVSLALTLILLALSGTARGETGRVWLFFGAFLVVVAARQFAPTQGERPPAACGSALASLAQAVTWLTLVGFLRVTGTELTPPPHRTSPHRGRSN